MIVYLDGRIQPEAEASISIHDRGFLLGDGVFETALLYNGGFFRLQQHLERLIASAGTLQIPAPPIAHIDEVARRLVKENGLADAGLRFTLSRGVDHPILLVTARPPDAAAAQRAAAGWRIITASVRRPSIAAIPAQLKALGRTHALLARLEAAAAGVHDALLLTDVDVICEGPAWNIFWRAGRRLFTPALDAGVLAGVTRSAVMDLAARAGFEVSEGLYPRSALDDADEIFATMTSAGLVTIHELDGRSIRGETEAVSTLLPQYRRHLAELAALDPA